jgi:hypothetical protein
MALFSNGNRKVRSRRPRTAQELGKTADSQVSATPRKLQRRANELGREIHRLECLIADAPRLQKQQRLATLHELPPLESPRMPQRGKKLSLAQRQQVNGRRLRLAIEWLVVAAAIASLSGWLNQWLHLWGR